MINLRKTLIAAAVAVCAASAQADPATVTITFDNPIFSGTPAPSYDAVTIHYPLADGKSSTSTAVHAGRFQGTVNDFNGVPESIFVDSVSDLWAYCYDVYSTISNGQKVEYTINFDGVQARTLDFLGAVNHVLNTGGGDDPWAWLKPENGYQAAAIQIGIWESLYESDENGWDIANGAFRATGLETDTMTALNQFFSALDDSTALESGHAMVLEAEGAQNMIVGDPVGGSVPEPGTLALLLAPAALLALRRRGTADRAA